MRGKLLIVACLLVAVAIADVKVLTTEFVNPTFTADAIVGWSIANNRNGQIISNCGKTIVGGFGVFGAGATATKTFNSGIDHTELLISLELYSIDTWDQEKFFLTVDDQIVYTYQGNHDYATPAPNNISCGIGYGDRLTMVSVRVPHFRRDFEVKLSTNLNEAPENESWGFRNFQVSAVSTGDYNIVSKEFLQNDFKKDLSGWDVNFDKAKVFTNCNGVNLFGGYNVFAKGSYATKTYSGLPVHSVVVVTFDLWFIDSVDGSDFVAVYVDGQIYKYYRPDAIYNDAENFLCGVAGWSEKQSKVSIQVPHRASSVTVQIRASIDQNPDDESFGFRNLQVGTIKCSGQNCRQGASDLTANDFKTAAGWVNADDQDVSSVVSTCSSQSYFGPHSGQVSKVFNLLPHSRVRVQVRVVALGNWADAQKLLFLINGAAINPKSGKDFEKLQVCKDKNESVRTYVLEANHASSFFEFSILPDGFGAAHSFAVRDVQVFTYQDYGRAPVANQFNGPNFETQNDWSIVGNTQGRQVTTCGRYSLFGGFNAFGRKTQISKQFNGLPTHDQLVISFAVWFVDTWDLERFSLLVDGTEVWFGTKANTWEGQRHICGVPNSKEEAYFVQVVAPHSAATATISFKDALDQGTEDESWGIRDLVIQSGSSTAVAPDVSGECISVFSECGFEGQSYPVCENIPDLKAIGWNTPIKSVYIPNGKSLKIFKDAQYKGDVKEVTDSQNCLAGKAYLLINKAFNIDVVDETPRLKKHHKRN